MPVAINKLVEQQLTAAYLGTPGYYLAPAVKTLAKKVRLTNNTALDVPGVFIHAVPSGGVAGAGNVIVSNFTLPAGDTVEIGDIMLLANGFIDAKAGTAAAVTISAGAVVEGLP